MVTQTDTDSILDALCDVAFEREQQLAKGWTAEHDDTHTDGCLISLAASILATVPRKDLRGIVLPFIRRFEQKNKPIRQRLIVAAALLIAEVERLDRAKLRSMPSASELTIVPQDEGVPGK